MAAITRLLAARADVVVAWLYGSRARGDEEPGSDIDLAVAFQQTTQAPWERIEALRAVTLHQRRETS